MFKEIIIMLIFVFIIQIVTKLFDMFWSKIWKIPEKYQNKIALELKYKQTKEKYLEKYIVPLNKYLFYSKVAKFTISIMHQLIK